MSVGLVVRGARTATVWMLVALSTGGAARAGVVSVQVVDRDGRPVPGAVALVEPAAGGQPRQALPRTATVQQRRLRFEPALTVVPVGAAVTFTNLDAFEHHVRGTAAGIAAFTSADRDGFGLRLDAAGAGRTPPAATEVMQAPGPVLLGCHFHASMRGHVYVSPTPWAQATTAEGQAVFDDVPEGPAKVRVWHPDQLVDLPAQTVAVGPQPTRVQVQLQVTPRPRRP